MNPSDGQELTHRLPRQPGCGAHARRQLEADLGARLSPAALETAKLVVTELVTNAYLHGRGAIQLKARLDSDRLRLEVVDEGSGQAVKIRERPDDNGGRGLRIIDQLALAWGAYEGTTHVWVHLPV
jgi:anti-sigma regulatory factor (Ser/Thr protein kinase)